MKFVGLPSLLAVAFAACLSGGTASDAGHDYSAKDAQDGAQFRSNAQVVVPILFPPCASSDALKAPMARYEQLKARLSENVRGVDLAIVEADYDYQMSLVDIACPELTEAEQREYDAFRATIAESAMSRMEDILKSNTLTSNTGDSD